MTRKRLYLLIAAAVLTIFVIIFSVWYFDGDRQLDRSWKGFIASIEDRSAMSVSSYLADDYTDTWGYDKPALSKDLWRILGQFDSLELTLVDDQIERTDDDHAIISAQIQMHATGRAYVADAQRQINAIATPFHIEWQRNSRFPWSWKVKRIEQPEFDAKRYPGRSRSGFSFPF